MMTQAEIKAEAAYLRSIRTSTQEDVDRTNEKHQGLARYSVRHDRVSPAAH